MNKRRLLKLATLLEKDAANPTGAKFDLAFWAQRPGSDLFPRQLKKLDCKTAACAVGLACLSGAFKKDGLTWKSASTENNIQPIYKGRKDFSAVDTFFGIDRSESMRLFAARSYRVTQGAAGELAVASRIREMVAAA